MIGTMISVPIHDSNVMPAYLALPQTRRGPCIIVLQEIFGLNASIRRIATAYAEEGYIAIAPDLFWRQQAGFELDPNDPSSRDRARPLMNNFDHIAAINDVVEAANHIRREVGDASTKIGVVGYCLGGKLAYQLAMKPQIDTSVAYYGTGIHNLVDQAQEVCCPFLMHVAKGDTLCPPEAQIILQNAFAPFSQKIKIAEYDEVGHAFARVGSISYSEPAARLADRKTKEFLEQHLS